MKLSNGDTIIAITPHQLKQINLRLIAGVQCGEGVASQTEKLNVYQELIKHKDMMITEDENKITCLKKEVEIKEEEFKIKDSQLRIKTHAGIKNEIVIGGCCFCLGAIVGIILCK